MNLPWYLQEPFAPARPQDLVLWLNSSSRDGTTWRNLAPSYSNVNHGTLKNGVALGEIHPSGVFGAPRKFDGLNDYVDCGNDSSLDITDAITIEAWVKNNENARSQGIISKFTGTNNGWSVMHYANNTFSLRTRMGVTIETIFSNSAYTDTNWHHLVILRTGGINYMYVDAVVQSQTSTVLGSTASQDVVIGLYSTGYPTTYNFNGPIDEVKIYNRALSASDVVHNHTHSPIYYMQHGVDPISLLSQTPQEAARIVA